MSQIEGLSSTMLNLRRKQILAQNQIEKMVKSKAEIECAFTEKEHQLNLIKQKFRIKNLNDLDEDEQNTLETFSNNQSESSSSPKVQSTPSSSTTAQAQDSLSSDLTNLLIYDAKDPNRPRFTLKELQKVLMEKNELTIKLDQTQDELEQLRKQ